MTAIPAYRVTPEDLPDADQKTRTAIRPLLERLNRCLTAVIALVNQLAASAGSSRSASFTTDGSGNATVTLGALAVTPKELWITALTPLSTSGQPKALGSSFAPPGWFPTTSGATLSFDSLSANTTYAFTARYL